MKKSIEMDKARFLLLRRFWDEILQKMVVRLFKKKKSKKDQDFLMALQTMRAEMREAVLKRYFRKCKNKHAAQFFEWRKIRKQLEVKVRTYIILILKCRNQWRLCWSSIEKLSQNLRTFCWYWNKKGLRNLQRLKNASLKSKICQRLRQLMNCIRSMW